MIDLIFWSFVVGLTPVALELAWRLASVIPHGIALGLARVHHDARPWGRSEFDPPL